MAKGSGEWQKEKGEGESGDTEQGEDSDEDDGENDGRLVADQEADEDG